MKFLKINLKINLIKDLLRITNLYNISCNFIDYFFYPKGSTIVVHVGRTGGTSLGLLLADKKEKKKFSECMLENQYIEKI